MKKFNKLASNLERNMHMVFNNKCMFFALIAIVVANVAMLVMGAKWRAVFLYAIVGGVMYMVTKKHWLILLSTFVIVNALMLFFPNAVREGLNEDEVESGDKDEESDKDDKNKLNEEKKTELKQILKQKIKQKKDDNLDFEDGEANKEKAPSSQTESMENLKESMKVEGMKQETIKNMDKLLSRAENLMGLVNGKKNIMNEQNISTN